jgi:hypothetical protein
VSVTSRQSKSSVSVFLNHVDHDRVPPSVANEGENIHSIVRGDVQMCKFIKCGFVLLMLAVIVYAFVDGRHAEIVAVKTAEGLLGGVLFGLVAAADKWFKVHRRAGFSLWRFRCVVAREVKVGLCTGFLVGVVVAVVALLTT